MKTFEQHLRLIFPIFLIALFFGCDLSLSKKSSDSSGAVKRDLPSSQGSVLLNINGKPVLRESDYTLFLNQMMQANPYFKGAGADILPAAVRRKLFDELVKQELIVAWANKNDIENSSEFQKAYEEVKKLARRSLLIQQFEKKIFDNISVSDREIKDEFNKNKDRFVKVSGGVLVSGIYFDDPEKANAFYNKVKNKSNVDNFNSAAKKENEEKFRDFGRVSSRPAGGAQMASNNDVPPMIKRKVLELKDLPKVEKIKAGRVTWVVHVSDKKEDVFFDIDEIRPQIESMIKGNKFRDSLDKKIKDLKKEFTVSINEDFFKSMEQRESAAREVKDQKPAEMQKEKVQKKKDAKVTA